MSINTVHIRIVLRAADSGTQITQGAASNIDVFVEESGNSKIAALILNVDLCARGIHTPPFNIILTGR